MSIGKMAAQVAHASVSSMEETRMRRPDWVREWLREGQKKVVLKVESEEELRQLTARCAILGLSCSLVEDAGLTELPPSTATALGVGPAPEELIDRLTGSLPLL